MVFVQMTVSGAVLILLIAVLANRTLKKAGDVPGTFQNVLEYAYEMLQKSKEPMN
mgnify:CR=1 FL=1